jgi:hypothetical protein
MTERVRPVTEYPSVPKQSIFLVQKIGYAALGHPLFGDRPGSRPGSAGVENYSFLASIR